MISLNIARLKIVYALCITEKLKDVMPGISPDIASPPFTGPTPFGVPVMTKSPSSNVKYLEM